VADVLAVAAELTAVVADFLAVRFIGVRVLADRATVRSGERQQAKRAEMTSHTESRLRVEVDPTTGDALTG